MKKLLTSLTVVAALMLALPALAAEHRGGQGMTQQGTERMQRMEQMMDRAGTGSRSDQQRLMTEHMGLMTQQMKDMDGTMERGKRSGDDKPMPQDDRLSMMGEQMQMMQQMMSQMLRHQEMMTKMMDDRDDD